ncbi:ATP-dependent zinc protease [Candidatus Saccharibacteria bacterium]|jgi:hypothetical protein|nr:ATP-dependent zinc protease [Candidatus Saccharibacteria bacterium]
MSKYKTIIGRAELLDFPAKLISDVPAKTDTGAYMSSIHATHIREVKKKNGKTVLKFNLLGGHPAYPYSREIEVQKFSTTMVENSFGERQQRYKVEFKVHMAGKVFRTSFTLADRSTKTFPILIGRTLLNKRFIVDTTVVHVDRKHLKKQMKEWLDKDDGTEDEEAQ